MYVSDADRFGTGGGIHIVDPVTGEGIGFLPIPSAAGEGFFGRPGPLAGESDWLAFNAAGNLFMTDEDPSQGVMQVNLSTGDIITPSFAANLPNTPYALSFDTNGDAWLGDTNGVLEFSPSGAVLRSIPILNYAVVFSAVFDPSGQVFYAGDNSASGRVYEYDVSGTLLGTFTTPDNVNGLSVAGGFMPLSRPRLTPGSAAGDVHDPTTVTAVLDDAQGEPVANEPVSFTLDDKETCTGTTDSDGTASCSLTPGEVPGTYTLLSAFAGDSSISLPSVTGTTSFTVKPEQAALSYAGAGSATAGGPITLSATMTTDDPNPGAPLPGKTVVFTLGTGASAQSCTATTGSDGSATCTLASVTEPVGSVPVTANFPGDRDYLAASASATISVQPSDPPIAAASHPLSLTEGQSFTGQVATFTDPDTSATPGEYEAQIDWGDGTTAAGTVTGGNGTFSVSGTHLYADEGSRQLTVTVTDVDNKAYAVTAAGLASIKDATLAAACALATMSSQSFSGQVATFADANPSGGAADFTATIDWGDGTTSPGSVSGPAGGPFAVNGTHLYASTGLIKTYTVKVSVTDTGGSTASTGGGCPLTIGGAAFVIGDKNAVVGTRVNFWGSQWATGNGLSQGKAPASFKGFSIATVPGNNALWQSTTGNSPPPPPSPLPTMITAIVTSSVRQNGAIITGNIVGVVEIRVEPGYLPDPGHPGFGVIESVTSEMAPALTTDSPPAKASVKQPYAYTFAATGAPAPKFGISAGSLPAGLSLDPNSGVLSGTPTRPGVFTFTVRAANGVPQDALSSALTISVAGTGSPPVFQLDSPPEGAAGLFYDYQFFASGQPAPTYYLASGSLPSGLTLDAGTGLLDGTPTVAGTFTFTVGATNGVAPDAVTPSIMVTVVNPVVPVFTADSPPATVTGGQPFDYVFAATGAPAPDFIVSSGTLPDGLLLDSLTGELSGTPTTPGVFTFTIEAVSAAGEAFSPSLTIDVAGVAPVFTAVSPPQAALGQPFYYFFAATGTPTPSFAVATGALPAGLTLDTASGELSGTPTTAAAFTFTITAANGVAPDALSPPLTIIVAAAATLDFVADTPHVPATVGAPYTYTFAAIGWPPPTYSDFSSLPPGLSIDPVTGVVSGRPTTAGSYDVFISAYNGITSASARRITFTVQAPKAPAFTADTPPVTWTLGSWYFYRFSASGAPLPTYALASGTLPGGLTLDPDSGILSGTPGTAGTFSFTVRASNGVSPDAVSSAVTITIASGVTAPAFTADSPPTTAAQETPYSYTFAATGTPAPSFIDTYGALPDGLTLDPATGQLSGTPTTAGTFTFTIRAANGTSPDTLAQPVTITVAPRHSPSFTAVSPPSTATVGTAYRYTFVAAGPPSPTYAVASGALPGGLSLDPTSGTLSGTPTTAGAFTFTIAASNGVAPDAISGSLTITVSNPVAPVFTANSPPSAGTVGTRYSYTFAATGPPAPTFTVASGTLPPGLILDRATGTLEGTPNAVGTFRFTIAAGNGTLPNAQTPSLTITVSPGQVAASDDSYTMQAGGELDVPAPGVLANDTAVEADIPLTAHIQQDNAVDTVLLRPDGSLSYVPPPGFTGVDTFTYEARDSAGDVSNVATVSITVNSGGPPTPTLTAISPAADTTITGPTSITATLAPPAGDTIASWTVSYHRPEDPTLIQLATGTGTNVSATFDPTLVRDGTYALDIKAKSAGGGVLQTESGLIVDGTYKPGRYATTIQDLTVNAANIPISIQRTYDSINKTRGDFGAGWTLNFANFRIDTNGPLGNGGWSATACGGFLNVCFTSTIPHVVTVTWPDGHVEKFDLAPASVVGATTVAQFTAEPGSTSTLQAVDSTITLTGSNLLEGGSGLFGGLGGSTGGIYDPLQFILTAKDGTQYFIDRQQGLLKETDPHGNTVTIDATGIHASSGPSVAFNRDSQDRISQIVGPAGTISYAYSAAGDLTSVAYPNGISQSFTYDSSHDLLSISGGGHVLRTLTYDSSGRIIAVTDGDGYTTTISTNVAGHQQVFTDALGTLTTVNTYDDRGDVIQQDQVYSGKTVTTKATYNSLGEQLSRTDPLGNFTSQTYDSAGDLLTRTDANGRTTTYTYNSFGEPLTITDPTGAVTTNTYDAAGNPLSTADPDGHVGTNSYNGAGQLVSTTDPTGRVTKYAYDGSGQPASITDSGGHVAKQAIDGSTGLITSITDPTGATTHLTYDADGNLITITDANGKSRSATYDSFDRVTSVTDPLGNTDLLTYDGAGNLVSVKDRNGNTITDTYDADSRLISKTVPGAGTTTYSYDPLGRLIAADNATAHLAFTYDDAGNMLTSTSTGTPTSQLPTATFTYTYDPAGNRLSAQGPAGTTAYAYDSTGWLATLTDPSGGLFNFGYDPAGQLTSLTRPNGVNDAVAYDGDGNLTSLHSTLGPALVSQADYAYNAGGLVSSVTTLGGTTTYSYDAASRLTSATYPASTVQPADNYTYDALGNRTSATGSPLGSFSYDSASRLLSDSTYTYTYDKEGDLLTRTAKAGGATTSYVWSADHELTSVTEPDGTVVTYKYDPFGRRVETDTGTTITRYAYDRQNIAAEYDGTNTLTASYVANPAATNQTLEMTRAGQRYFYLTDAQHSTTALTTLSGTVAASYTYTAFGAPTEAGSLANPFTYTGQPYDATAGLLLYPLRPYDPGLGRFLAEDPVASVNPYPCATDDPVNKIDPNGAETEAEDTATRCVSLGSSATYLRFAQTFGLIALNVPL
jgi:RHS repeat-associated protein